VVGKNKVEQEGAGRESFPSYFGAMDKGDFEYQYLDPARPIRRYRRHLPHWRQEGVLYFTTFRLADSIPARVLRGWNEDRRRWLEGHGVTPDLPQAEWTARYQQIPEGVRRAFEREEARRLHVELDRCHGRCALRDPEAAAIVEMALLFFHGKRLHCGDFVIMPNHVHWIVAPYTEDSFEKLLGSIKRYAAVHINKLVGRTGTLWQQESFDRIVRDGKDLDRIREYIKENPAKAKLGLHEYRYRRCDWLKVGRE